MHCYNFQYIGKRKYREAKICTITGVFRLIDIRKGSSFFAQDPVRICICSCINHNRLGYAATVTNQSSNLSVLTGQKAGGCQMGGFQELRFLSRLELSLPQSTCEILKYNDCSFLLKSTYIFGCVGS